MEVKAKKSDWKTEEMPEQNASFMLKRTFTEEQMAALMRGNIPEEMEDKWFWYYENGRLYAHRSWTGFCIYIITFNNDTGIHKVTVNRNPEQYTCVDVEEDLDALNCLLDWWTQPKYDYYHEGLSETLNNINEKISPIQRMIRKHKIANEVHSHKTESKIEIEKGDITKLDCECIVNAANNTLLGGGGVDGAIHRAAGGQLLEECRTLHGCNTGEAKITGGYNLKANYVIHTVGPVYSGSDKDKILLSNCYWNSMELAKENNIHSIAFPAISAGVYGYPLEKATPIAIGTIKKWIKTNQEYGMHVILCCFNQKAYEIYQSVINEEE